MNRKKLAIFLLALGMLGCRKQNSTDNNLPPVGGGSTVAVNVNQNQPGSKIPANFQGLSFETKVLSENPEFLNPNNAVLIQMIKNLGPGILRIGGGTSDLVYWTGHERTPTVTDDSLTTSDIDRMVAFDKIIGWPVLFGLNLGANDIPAAVNEAIYVHAGLGKNLYAFQSGNEPDVFNYGIRPTSYNYNGFQFEWDTYKKAINAVLPQDAFAGPDVAYNTDWVGYFGEANHDKIKLLDSHFYVNGPASTPSINYHTILDYSLKLPTYLAPGKSLSSKYNVPYRITECNSIWGGGKPGTSDVFAATLWALDFMWNIASNNGDGVNFHGGKGLYYSPVLMGANKVYKPGAVYYAMLAFKYGSTNGTFIPTSTANSTYCNAYTVLNTDNSYTITLINKDDVNDHNFSVQLNNSATGIDVARLIAPTITSSTGITFAGSSVNSDGTFEPGLKEHYEINSKSFTINIPSGSAAVINVK